MQTIAIAGKTRSDLGKKATKAVRRDQEIPCVMYGGGENVHFSAPEKAFRDLVYTPEFKVVEFDIDGKNSKAILKNVQFHPLTDRILHMDFVELVDGKKVILELPIKIVGVSEGVKNGGALMLKMRRIKVEATPEKMVYEIPVDITPLNLGQSVRVRDIEAIDGVTILSGGSNPVASVEVPRALRSAEAKDAVEGGEEEGAAGEAEA